MTPMRTKNVNDTMITLPATPNIICEDITALTREEWLRKRKVSNIMLIKDKGLYLPVCWGGSDLAAILGVSPWETPLEIWKKLRGEKLMIERKMPQDSLDLGHKFEAEIAEKYANKEGIKLIQSKRMYQSRQYPWMIADFDYLAIDHDGSLVGVEIKYTDQYNYDFKRLVRNGGIPIHYEAQMRHYMIVSGLKKWYIAVGSSEGNLSKNTEINNIESTYIEWDEDREDEIIQASEAFIERVVNGIEPDMTTVEDTNLVLESILRAYGHADEEKTVELSSKYRKQFEKVFAQTEKISELERTLQYEQKRLETLTIPFMQALQDARMGYLMVDEETAYVAEYEIKKRNTLDKNMVRQLDPNVYEKYLKESGPQLVKKNHPDLYEKCMKESITRNLAFKKAAPK